MSYSGYHRLFCVLLLVGVMGPRVCNCDNIGEASSFYAVIPHFIGPTAEPFNDEDETSFRNGSQNYYTTTTVSASSTARESGIASFPEFRYSKE